MPVGNRLAAPSALALSIPGAARRGFTTALLLAAGLIGPATAVAAPSTTSLLVKFQAGTPGSVISQTLAPLGADDVRTIPDIGVRVVSVPSSAAAHAWGALKADRKVQFVERDAVLHANTVTPNDYYYPVEWGLPKVNLPTVWGTTEGSPAVTVAVIDSGLTTSADLQGNIVPGWNFLTGMSDTTDDFGHGTQVAGVIAAQSNNTIGVTSYCWHCSLMPLEVLDSSGWGSTSNVASAIDWATDHGARIINLSLGGSGSSTLQSAVSYAESRGVVLVASAGNSGCNCVQYPAGYSGVLSVAATNSSDQLESYSNYGPWVEVAAPGTTYSVTWHGTYASFAGTSAAAPAVAGIAGLLLSADPSASASAVISAIESSAVNVGSFVAHGRVDANTALNALLGTGGTTGGSDTSPPADTAPPAITGSPQQGQTLTASSGTWSGSPTAYAYQWARCDTSGANCLSISGATASTYALTSADVGSTLEVAVTATNSGGSASAGSAPTAVVQAGAQTQTFSGSFGRKGGSQTISVTAGAGTADASLSFSCTSLQLSLTSGGTLIASTSGPSVLTLSDNLAAGSYGYVVSGSGKCSFTLTVSAAAP